MAPPRFLLWIIMVAQHCYNGNIFKKNVQITISTRLLPLTSSAAQQLQMLPGPKHGTGAKHHSVIDALVGGMVPVKFWLTILLFLNLLREYYYR